jgi:hypothetical protein
MSAMLIYLVSSNKGDQASTGAVLCIEPAD